eukprot:TRINITY_DN38551_c0_g1_i1.p1 TRINITY_DN38551_c0_g1~~TRINITY_DN38551_c0_g1_i1.p1  ORF type:complete len:188 (+),score=41.69 TRINITY_DN38551_c0_g1_i1:70-633(+)
MRPLMREEGLLRAVADFLDLEDAVVRFGATCSIFAAVARDKLAPYIKHQERRVNVPDFDSLHDRLQYYFWAETGTPFKTWQEVFAMQTNRMAGCPSSWSPAERMRRMQRGNVVDKVLLSGLRCASLALLEGVTGATARRAAADSARRHEAEQALAGTREEYLDTLGDHRALRSRLADLERNWPQPGA